MKAILIYSGGLDSTTLLYEYKDSIALALTFDYGSKHNAREIAYARENCRRLGIPHRVIENMKSTVVPFRNGVMLSIAIGLAESNDLDTVLIANHAGDHTIYPDCRPEFIAAMDAAAAAGTFNGVRIVSPYCNIPKRDIALRGRDLGVDFSLTYSCYKGGEVHCGKCGTCIERKEALEGFDTTKYECP